MPLNLSFWKRWKSDYLPPSGRTGELFCRHLHQIQERTDRLFYYLLLIQYPAAVAVALIWSPLAWSGSQSSIHFHVWLAVILGGLLTSLPVYLIRTSPATSLTRQVISVAQMLMGALLIHLSGGRIETHFHVFGSLAFLAFYRDLRVLATATVVVVLDHLIRGLLVPGSVYGIVSASNWRFVEHAFWVIFENIFLSISCVQGRAQLSAIACQQAQLEAMNENIEAAVRIRTQELLLKSEELAAARDVAMESTRLKSQFLANVSHEIRTPLNGVLGMTSVLLETDLTPDQRDCAKTVQSSAEGLLTVVKDILDLSKIEAGKLALEPVDYLLCSEIENVVRLFAEPAEKKKLDLVCEIDRNVPALVTGDAGRFRQILLNLLGNAIKFSEHGEVTVRAVQVGRETSTARVRFEVADTGIGIAEDAQKMLFQTFVQVDGSSTRRHEGTGLGLAISKQLVDLMAGEIGFESSPGVGSTFWFEIPVQVISDADQASLVRWDALRGLRILIVNDRPRQRTGMLRTIESFGMRADQAADAREALKALESAVESGEPFDLALVDLHGPEIDAIQLARAVRKRERLNGTELLLLLSREQKAFFNSLGPVAHVGACLLKPVRREKFFLTIEKLCRKAAAGVTSRVEEGSSCATSSAATQLSVLVAEDNVVNQRVLGALLSRLGHRFDVVADGGAAIEAAKRSAYDVVLMDCQMPRVDGFDATAGIRKLPGAAGQVPIVAVTANAMSGDRERCLAAGMNGYVPKPVSLIELAAALNSMRSEPARAF